MWSGSPTLPTYDQVMMSPVVADLDNDCMPDIVFATFTGGSYGTDGVIRAVSGDGRRELFTVSDPALRVVAGAQLALAEVDGDHLLEIFACQPGPNRNLMAVNFDGTLRWRAANLSCGTFDAPQVVDVDHDGQPEVVVGFSVFNARTGASVGTPPTVVSPPGGLYTTAAELDGDAGNGMELVGGGVVYHHDGTLYWSNVSGAAGYPAVADLDGDGRPEVVSVSQAAHTVTAYHADGGTLWGPIDVNNGIPTSSGPVGGGPPVIADLDGDGLPDVGVSGGYAYLALRGTNGAVLWQQPIRDLGSRVSGSTAFDFNGDDAGEVLNNDEGSLRVFDGLTGQVELSTCSTSGTLFEYPLVVDVDGDEHADLVTPSNTYAFPMCDAAFGGGPSRTGFTVLADVSNRWVRTRKIWNQHTYHVTNINDDGTVPRFEAPNWLQPGLNNFRQSVAPTRRFSAADLVPRDLRMSAAGCGQGQVLLSTALFNQGEAVAPAGARATFYFRSASGPVAIAPSLQTIAPLLPGAAESGSVVWTPPSTGPFRVWVVVDDDGTSQGAIDECDEVNNTSAEIIAGCP